MKLGYRLQVTGNRKILFVKFFLVGLFFLAVTYSLQPTPSLAQQVSPTVKKDVVKNYKANLNTFSPFGSSQGCPLKNKGDANCDGSVNQFDLSIWEIEFSTKNSPLRSDFNNDGVVNLVDYGVWRNTFYVQKKALLNPECSENHFSFNSIAKLLNCYIAKTQITFAQQFNNITIKQLIPSIFAQEVQAPQLNSSTPFIPPSGNSQIYNTTTKGSQQISFDDSGSPVSSQIFNDIGRELASVAYSPLGATIINTEQDGIPVQITKTGGGAVIQSFRNPDGSLLAIKSWPTQLSYDAGEPPLSVTVPGQGNIRNVLNIQPNGDSILEKTDTLGNPLVRNQIRSNSTLITEDLQNRIIVQSNSEAGFTTLTLENNLGGKTDYMFYQGQLYTIVQTNSKGETYIAKPLNLTGDSWSFSNINDQNSPKTITNPIAELGSNTPNPQDLINDINYYKSQTASTNNINFTDTFPTNSKSEDFKLQKANQILTINNAPPPSVLGLIKEAYAQNTAPPPPNTPTTSLPGHTLDYVGPIKFDTNDGWSYQWDVKDGAGNYTGFIQVQLPSLDNKGVNAEPDKASYGHVVATSRNGQSDSAPITSRESLISIANRSETVDLTNTNRIDGVATIPASAGGGPPAAPPVPAIPAAAPVAPVAPAVPAVPGGAVPALRNPDRADQGNQSNPQAGITEAMTKAAGDAADKTEGKAAEKSAAAFEAAIKAGANVDQASRLASDSFMVAAVREASNNPNWGGGGNQLAALRASGLTEKQANDKVTEGIEAINAQRALHGAPPIGPASLPSFNLPGGPATTSGGTSPAAATAPGVGVPTSGLMADGRHTSTVKDIGGGNFESTIKDAQGNTVATQRHNPSTGTSDWSKTDSNGTTHSYASFGQLTATSINGQTMGLDADGGFSVGGYIDGNGYVVGGHPASDTEKQAWNAAAREQGLATGAQQTGFDAEGKLTTSHVADGFCFLPGTLISTPDGPTAIESLKPGDKVYSYNEKTGVKEISDFKELDINFVDEYLVINNKIKTTAYHPFYKIVIPSAYEESIQTSPQPESINWIPASAGMTLKTIRADHLKIGDILLNEQGEYISISSIERINAPKTTVYNLMNVSKNNNFFAEGILVHNYGAESQPGDNVDQSQSNVWDSTNGGAEPGTDSQQQNQPENQTESQNNNNNQNENFNNDTSNGSDANSSGADSSGW